MGAWFHRIAAVLIFPLFVLLNSCSGKADLKVDFSKDFSAVTIRRGKVKRTALLTLPKSLKFNAADGNEKFSIVLVLHGANSSPEEIRQVSGLDDYADALNYIFVYPKGIGGRWDSLTDNVFFNDLIGVISEKYKTSHVYATGFSAGAVKVFDIPEILGEKVQAIAPVSGLLKFKDRPEELMPVNLLHIHSMDDTEVPSVGSYEEGYYSVEEELDIYRRISSRDSENPKEVREFFHEKQGHSWNKKNTELIADFFYNHPSRQSRLTLKLNSDSFLYGCGEKIKAIAEIENPETVEGIKIFSGWNEVYSKKISGTGSTVLPLDFEFSTKAEGMFHLRGELLLKCGEKISSTINPYFISLKTEGAESGSTKLKVVHPVYVKASSIESSFLKESFCVDGNLSTRWSSGWNDNESILFEFSEPKEIKNMVLFWETASATSYEFLGSSDGKEWNRLYVTQNSAGNIETINLPSSESRYIKINLQKRKTKYGFSLWEVFFLE